MKKTLIVLTHVAALSAGFASGIYALPILIEPAPPVHTALQESKKDAIYSATFQKDLKGSDFFHWGEGELTISGTHATFEGRLAPGPDYYLYLTPTFADDEAGFLAIKDASLRVAPIKTFNGFIVELPSGLNLESYSSALVWCEHFGEFISAGEFRMK
ncbi:MAG TPA: DM13 domain-containing protein [Limnobacter sp.]|nr:DM13 domain-containing protein [Limnobacter sp.]